MYLTHLLTQTLPETPSVGEAIQPRPLSRFEPGPSSFEPVSSEWEILATDHGPVADTPPPHHLPQPRAVAEPPLPSSFEPPTPVQPVIFPPVLPIRMSKPAVVEMPVRPHRPEAEKIPASPNFSQLPAPPHTGRLDTPSLPRRERQLSPVSPVESLAPAVIRKFNIEQIHEHILSTSISHPTPQPDRQPLTTLELPENPKKERTYQSVPRPAPPASPTLASHPLATPSIPHLTPRLPAMPPSLPAPQPVSAPAPIIHVTIGRVEVRATTPPTPPTRKPTPQPAVMTLDDYLKSRNGGSR